MEYKILAVHDTASCYQVISKMMRSLGHTIQFYKKPDKKLQFSEFYGERDLPEDISDGDFINNLFEIIPLFNIIHISSDPALVERVKFAFPNKKVVFHCHGWEVRERLNECRNAVKVADLTLCTTTDLVKMLNMDNVYHLPHAVDTDHFAKRDIKSDRSICFINPFKKEMADAAKQHLKDLKVEITYVPLYEMTYSKVPDYLSQFGFYYDCKFDTVPPYRLIHDAEGDTMSRMAQEALSLGLIVFDGEMNMYVGMDEKNTREKVIERLLELYGGMYNA